MRNNKKNNAYEKKANVKNFPKQGKDSRSDQPKGKRIKHYKDATADERYEAETAPSMKNPNAKNDASWYTYSTPMLDVASAINYNDAIGVPYSEQPQVTSDGGATWWATTPSVMSLYWTPTPGMATTNGQRNATNAPVNLQLRSLYSLMQATVTQNLPFAAADLGIHLMFMDSVFIMWGHMQRFYYTYRLYKSMNRTLPDTILDAYGMKRSTLEAGDYTIADFQADMLTMEQELRRIAVPEGFDILNRHYWMTKHVFMDANTIKPQMYIFVPESLWQFDAEGASGGELKLIRIPSFGSSGMKGMMTFFRNFLRTYYNDENIWNLNGYILRAFQKFWVPDAFVLDGILQPSYEPEVLMQIHNATICGKLALETEPSGLGGWGRIRQTSTDDIIFDPIVLMNSDFGWQSVGGGVIDPRILIDMPKDVPTPAETMVATRLTVRGNYVGEYSGVPAIQLTYFGTELINRCRIFDGINQDTWIKWGINVYDEGGEGIILTTYDILNLSRFSKFSGSPMLPVVIDHTVEDDEPVYEWVDYIGDITNFVVIESKILGKLHDSAAMGEWLIKS